MPGGGDSGAPGAGNRISKSVCSEEGGAGSSFILPSPPTPTPAPTTSTPGAGRAHWFTEHVHLIASVLWTLLFSLPLSSDQLLLTLQLGLFNNTDVIRR